ncbi:hypothetical protein M422DRAFT_263480 [Sphaerobolus stellatus SS14]|uniref:Unplaced genomic scaffold SPHSTscaffold_124, whole genome shotgun sequence n=1 Tax=Sphaerobolus stellatus (strain SS14) TaxID=990650 RepID=A0A0C9VAJ9_SPHS4|nr:hypothetical protein M422DRAFT_263480 [Sphaerobolus stellatus SS14]
MPQLGPQSSSPLIIQGSSPEDVSALGSEDGIVVAPYPQINEDVLSNCCVWLDPTADDEDKPEEVSVKVTVLKLIAEAKKFKSFGSLLTLHAIKREIIPSLSLDLGKEEISEATAWCWLIKLGYALKEALKGMYFDGHEWDDVVKYRAKFLTSFLGYERLCYTYSDMELEPIPPVIWPGEKLHVPISHDESIFHSNDL